MQCAATDQYSYAEAKVTKEKLTIDLLDIKSRRVRDTGDRSDAEAAPPCSRIVIPAK
jgi:hypothetical protein